ncbi:MAG: TlpA family protein disulfide reductase [Pyrinomonadaceae bacterium]|nr:TlpA family protein disulfide reductase [Pyrinomonadaceae bacterium]
MKRTLLPTLFSIAALLFAGDYGGRVSSQSPARKGAAVRETAPKSSTQTKKATTAGTKTTTIGATTPAKRAAAKATVRVVDDVELAKLIRRDAKQPRPLLVNFWATWCEPCRAEFPDLVQIDNQYRARGLDFFTVSLDDVAEATKNVPQFLREVRAEQIPAYLLNAVEPEAAITAVDKEWRGELPATFLFDKRGQLVFKHSGRVKPDELKIAIEKVMSDK